MTAAVPTAWTSPRIGAVRPGSIVRWRGWLWLVLERDEWGYVELWRGEGRGAYSANAWVNVGHVRHVWHPDQGSQP